MVGVIGNITKKIWNTLTVYKNKKIQFRDTGLYIHSDSDGNLKIASDGSITLSGMVKYDTVTKTADENIDGKKYSFIELDGTSANVQLTNLNAYQGQFLVLTCKDATNTVSVACKSGTTLDGTNTTATFTSAGQTLVLFGISSTQFVILENIGSVSLS